MKSKKLKLLTTKIGSGITPRGGSSVYLNDGTYLIRSQNIYNDRFDEDGLVCIDDKTAQMMSGVEVKENDVLINITGDSVARTFIISKEYLPARVNQHVAILRTNSELNPHYLYYFLIDKNTQNYLLSIAGSGGTRNALTKEMLENLEIEYPNYAEQEKVSKHLNNFKNFIELKINENIFLEKILQTIFKSWFVDFDGETEFVDSEIGQIPHGWKLCSLSEIFEINPPRKLEKGKLASYVEMANMPTNTARIKNFVKREYKGGTKFINGDTLVARITPCLENGKTAFVDILGNDETGYGSTEYIILHPKHPIPAEFGYFVARNETFRSHAIINMTGTSGRQRVHVESLTDFKLPLSPINFLNKFAHIAKNIFSKMKKNDEERKRLIDLRDSLLPKLMSGEIRV